jgi:uncharacterized protein with HEPN domain
MPRDWLRRIDDVRDTIQRIETYTAGMDETAFTCDQKARDAVLYNLQIIGEAIAHLPEDVLSKRKDIPWSEIRAMRNILAHGYFAVKILIIWHTVVDDVPKLKASIEDI